MNICMARQNAGDVLGAGISGLEVFFYIYVHLTRVNEHCIWILSFSSDFIIIFKVRFSLSSWKLARQLK